MTVETIAAIATAPGRAAVGILRISGPAAGAIGCRIAGKLPPPGQMGLRSFRDATGEAIDRGLLVFFKAPRSFTGEDVVELQTHGSGVVLDMLLQSACASGARIARPGEFSERAFLNGRLDLAQAEAIADLIDAGSQAAARAAARSMEGLFSARTNAIIEQLIGIRSELEAALDFSDEELPGVSSSATGERLAALNAGLARLLKEAGQGRRLREGLRIAIVGQPNVGKSTLLNRLAGSDVAIVSPVAGTTRDAVRESIVLDGLPLTIIDTAGLRDTLDPVEREGVLRARTALRGADIALFVVDDRSGIDTVNADLMATLPAELPRIVVRNKCDLSGRDPAELQPTTSNDDIRICAASGAGVELLGRALRRLSGINADSTSLFSARARHVEALGRAATHLARARAISALGDASAELVAEDLRLAQQALEEITGRFTPDQLLDRIFSSFCLGK